ncbi:large subunit ribosomal protein L28e [Coccidioides immitis RS]|uniref:Large subunit ribosomal protein L28e n=5 Tax=Coccidioides TaxID=5500 RepID=A0A0E1RZ20_COCIM|nr:large subunit ribosomal protein L28e [Coccidioides immitis RS]XP_003071189.1 60S ribosomal protein L28, putative [Coccidioides posadasii C735 delta SOWgp]EFW22545.1 conserved hypothetical protein [Coccidioides posadasii str. Silveira]KMM63912.1 hypothetical protein CPAG_00265 [Coccidioides posadasii RMSCC 3488]KMP10173.1 hypothetical protein CIRG_09406 [Coccidioides immitis RMSCC 2394]TPX24780.1 hypothetical protein DIZ76_010223 [Coccidioides immitis]EAS37227.1 large subunit ribosomal prot|eukprot:XP_003071189.1 60S ribosomal protein L28, putative [Coccidioides posadasii C735 delta SOWgp]
MAAAGRPNVSEDLVWEIVRSQNSFLVNRKSGGGARFTRDPLNLTNVHTRKYSGFSSNKAVGIQAAENNGLTVSTKRPGNPNQPAKNVVNTPISGTSHNRKVYKGVANRVVLGGYRPDLRAEAVARASAIRQSQRPKKDAPERKPRGAKARKAAEKAE